MVDPLLAAFSEDEINNGRIAKDHKNEFKEIDKSFRKMLIPKANFEKR